MPRKVPGKQAGKEPGKQTPAGAKAAQTKAAKVERKPEVLDEVSEEPAGHTLYHAPFEGRGGRLSFPPDGVLVEFDENGVSEVVSPAVKDQALAVGLPGLSVWADLGGSDDSSPKDEPSSTTGAHEPADEANGFAGELADAEGEPSANLASPTGAEDSEESESPSGGESSAGTDSGGDDSPAGA